MRSEYIGQEQFRQSYITLFWLPKKMSHFIPSDNDELHLLVGHELLPVAVQYRHIKKCDPDSYLYIQCVTKFHELRQQMNAPPLERLIDPPCSVEGFIAVIEYIKFILPTEHGVKEDGTVIHKFTIANDMTKTLFSLYNNPRKQRQLYEAFDACIIEFDVGRLLDIAIDVANEDGVRRLLRDPDFLPTKKHFSRACNTYGNSTRGSEIIRQLIHAHVPIDLDDLTVLDYLVNINHPEILQLVLSKGYRLGVLDYDLLAGLLESNHWQIMEILLVHHDSDLTLDRYDDDRQVECKACEFMNFVDNHINLPTLDEYRADDAEFDEYDWIQMLNKTYHTFRVMTEHFKKYVFRPCCLQKVASLEKRQQECLNELCR